MIDRLGFPNARKDATAVAAARRASNGDGSDENMGGLGSV
jgi:hypothetical protein